ncbi:unnamed protein product [Amoebophrya sp. A120]|nr:unnamed protein product [Amoebophrya sp. A120]|eukprot:GSA120T00000490001.1
MSRSLIVHTFILLLIPTTGEVCSPARKPFGRPGRHGRPHTVVPPGQVRLVSSSQHLLYAPGMNLHYSHWPLTQGVWKMQMPRPPIGRPRCLNP